MRMTGIDVCIWDMDGTLYRTSERMSREVLESAYRVIGECTGWKRDKVIAEYQKLHDRVTPSSTEITAICCKMTTVQAALATDTYFNRKQFLRHDPALVTVFEKLRGFRHFLLGNGTIAHISDALKALGITPSTFEEIVTSEIVGVNKPDESGFRYIMEKTGMSAARHLMIGDREAIDIAPAKNVGMKTCLVWRREPSMLADITIPTIYDITQILV